MQLAELRHLALIAEKRARQDGNCATADALREFADVCGEDCQVSCPRDSWADRLPSTRLPFTVGPERESQLSRC